MNKNKTNTDSTVVLEKRILGIRKMSRKGVEKQLEARRQRHKR